MIQYSISLHLSDTWCGSSESIDWTHALDTLRLKEAITTCLVHGFLHHLLVNLFNKGLLISSLFARISQLWDVDCVVSGKNLVSKIPNTTGFIRLYEDLI